MRRDTKQLPDWGPFQMRAYTEHDYDSRPDDGDWATPKQIAAWENDDWHYVGIVVEVLFQGTVIGQASLWGIESGYFTMTDEDDNVISQEWIDPLNDVSTGSFMDDIGNEACLDAVTFIEQLQAVEVPA